MNIFNLIINNICLKNKYLHLMNTATLNTLVTYYLDKNLLQILHRYVLKIRCPNIYQLDQTSACQDL